MSMIESNGFSPTESRSTTTEMMVSRQAQEVQAAMVIAKRFPRDEYAAYNKIMTSCKRPKLAKDATYTYPRGGTQVTGPSIRLAEAIAAGWGNIDYGVIELEQKAGESQMMAYAWDLETNTRRTMIFNVKHERHTKKGANALNDPRDIYELTANNGARRVRACILGVIPGDVVDAALEQCQKTLVDGETKPLQDSIREMLAYFKDQHQVSQEMIEKYIGWKAESFSIQDVIKLRGVAKSLKDGMAKREDYFELVRVAPTETNSKAEDAFKQQQGSGKKDKPAPPPPEPTENGGDPGGEAQDELDFDK